MKSSLLAALALACSLVLLAGSAWAEATEGEPQPIPQKHFDLKFVFEKPLPPILVGSGVALVSTALVLQLASLNAWRQFNSFAPDARASGLSQFQRVEAIQSRATTDHTLAVISGSVGIACLFMGSFLLWDRWYNELPPKKHKHYLSLQPQPNGLSLAFDFS